MLIPSTDMPEMMLIALVDFFAKEISRCKARAYGTKVGRKMLLFNFVHSKLICHYGQIAITLLNQIFYMDIFIREALAADAGAIADLMSQLGYSTSPIEMEARLNKIPAHKDYMTWVANTSSGLAGMIGSARGLAYESNFVHIRILVLIVDERYRNGYCQKIIIIQCWNPRKANEAQIILSMQETEGERKQAHLFYPQMGFDHKSSGYVETT